MKRIVIMTIMVLVLNIMSPTLLIANSFANSEDEGVNETEIHNESEEPVEEQEVQEIKEDAILLEEAEEANKQNKQNKREESSENEIDGQTESENDQEPIQEDNEGVQSNKTTNEENEKESETEVETSDEEPNEFGIKPGTMVYGEDISKLSEEELQYIPEGWRDGVTESEHNIDEDEADLSLFRARHPNVNKYIKGLKPAKVEYDHKSFFEKFNTVMDWVK